MAVVVYPLVYPVTVRVQDYRSTHFIQPNRPQPRDCGNSFSSKRLGELGILQSLRDKLQFA